MPDDIIERLTIATDGGCHPNPGPGGWAWVAEDGSYGCGSFAHGTNNIGELTAIGEALLAHPQIPLRIIYDSEYAKNCVTVWAPKWFATGKASGKKNIEIIRPIVKHLEQRPVGADVIWEWVRGHTGHPLNEAADKLASRMVKVGADTTEEGIITL